MNQSDIDLVIAARKKDVIIAKAHDDMWTVYYNGGFVMMRTNNIKSQLKKLPNKPWWKFWI